MAIFPTSTKPIAGNRFPVRGVGSSRQAAATAPTHAPTAHTHSMLAQAARNPRLNNISSVGAMLKAHAGASRGKGK